MAAIKILNPIVTPVSAERSPSGQMRVKSNGGGKLLAVKRCEFDEQAAEQIVRALNSHATLVAFVQRFADAHVNGHIQARHLYNEALGVLAETRP